MQGLDGYSSSLDLESYGSNKLILVQDSTLVPGAKNTQTYLKKNLPIYVPEGIWNSSSPDLNVFDFWLFSVIEEQSTQTSHCFVKSLYTGIRRALRILDNEEVRRSWSLFR